MIVKVILKVFRYYSYKYVQTISYFKQVVLMLPKTFIVEKIFGI